MKYGFTLPQGDARTAAALAREAEIAGWDGFFVWEPVWGIDPWVSLAAAAMVTQHIRLGTMVTPVSRRRPWKLASETATLDHLSGGRVILSVGLGAIDTGFAAFGEETDRRQRAQLLDEGLAIVTGLWQGQPFRFNGTHYQVQPTEFMPPPPPVQQPRIPIWVVGAWPRPRSMQRALRWDGILPAIMTPEGGFVLPTPADVQAIAAYAAAHRPGDATPLEIVLEGETPGDDPGRAASIITPLAAAGMTWWIETMWSMPPLEEVRRRIRQGPPRPG